jgi:hypothetical protein
MAKYTVSYTQTAYWTMEVNAKNEDEATEKAEKKYKDDTEQMEWGGVTDSFYQVEG